MSDSPQMATARIEAARRRARMMATAHELQQRLSPGTLARDAWHGAKGKGADLAEDAVDVVRNRPLAAGGVIAALTLFLAREPLIDLASRLWSSSEAKPATRRKPNQDKAAPAHPNTSDMEEVE